MKSIIFFILFFTAEIFSQSQNILWVINPKIGTTENELKIESVLNSITLEENIKAVVVTGSITANGSVANLKKAKQIFSRFSQTYFIPGKKEKKASSLYGTRFTDEFENPYFSFLLDSSLIIGVNNSVDYLDGKGYFPIESNGWINDELENVSTNQNIILFTNNALSNTLNSDKFYSNFNHKKLVAVFSSDFTKKSYNKLHIATPSGYLSKKDKNELKIKIIKISNYEVSTIEIGATNGKTTPRTYKLLQTPLDFPNTDNFNKSKDVNIIWSKDIQYSMIADPVIYENKIITSDKSGLVTCFNLNGEKLWDYDVFGDILCTPTVADGFLAVATAQGDLTTIDIKSGESLQTIGFDEAIITPLLSFDFKGSRKLMVPKKTNSNAAVIIGTETGKLFCLDMETLEEIWHTNILTQPVLIKPILIGNNLYFTSTDGYLYCLDSRDGTFVWKTKFAKSKNHISAKCNLVTDNKNIYMSTIEGRVYSINALLGKINWVKKYKAWQSIGISTDYKKLLVMGINGRINIVKPGNGRAYKIVTTNLGKNKFSTIPLFNHKMFFAASPRGKVIRINKKYSYKTILNFVDSPLHSVQKIDNQKYLASDYDGKIIVFQLLSN